MVSFPIKCIPFETHRTVFLPWAGLCAAAAERIGAVIGRHAEVRTIVEECDWWAFSLVHTKLSRCDLQMLFIAFDADEQDIEDNTLEPEVQATACLSNGLSFKIVRTLIPIKAVALSIATPDGLWLVEDDLADPHLDSVVMRLPNGQLLRASANPEDDYPSLDIGILHSGDEAVEYLCFAEWNPDRKGRELCIGAYTQGEEEPSYYESYAKGA